MLSITGLSKTYDNGVHALQGVDLSIGKGMFGLLGPNGAGKSSLMRTISTLQSADSGAITFDGIDVFKDPQALRQIWPWSLSVRAMGLPSNNIFPPASTAMFGHSSATSSTMWVDNITTFCSPKLTNKL